MTAPTTTASLSNDTIYNENCLDTMGRMPDGFVDLTVTSPPYDDLRTYNGYSFDFENVARELFRVTKRGGVAIWIVGDSTANGSETCTSFRQALFFRDIGFNIHDTMVYQKANCIPLTHRRYEQAFEFMFCFSKGRPKTFNPIMIPCKNAGKLEKYGQDRRLNHGKNHAMRLYAQTTYKATRSHKQATNIFSYSVGEKTGHPAAFPTQLAHDQITTWSNPGDLVYDPFMGSGTVAKCCRTLNRSYIGSEISKEYCEIAARRVDGVKSNTRADPNNNTLEGVANQ